MTAPELPPLEPETRALGYGLKLLHQALEQGFRDRNTDAIEGNDTRKQSVISRLEMAQREAARRFFAELPPSSKLDRVTRHYTSLANLALSLQRLNEINRDCSSADGTELIRRLTQRIVDAHWSDFGCAPAWGWSGTIGN